MVSERSWLADVEEAEGEERNEPEIAYEFSNGREFEDNPTPFD